MKNPITLKALVFLDDASESIFQMDCIVHVGKTWLVPIWLESLSKEHKTPARLILLDNLPHQDNGPNSPFGRYTLQIAIPKVLLSLGQLPPMPPFVVLDLPDGDRLPAPNQIH
jgi:hypothetical protein